MDSAAGDGTAPGATESTQRACMACRGSGEVVSHLGGSPKTLTCPWCDGTGKRGAVSDAQSRWADRGAVAEDA
jgi:DnaJ-class molecular chaperone